MKMYFIIIQLHRDQTLTIQNPIYDEAIVDVVVSRIEAQQTDAKIGFPFRPFSS